MRLESVVRRTHDAKTRSETIEKNSMVNDIKGSAKVDRETKSGKPAVSCMIDRIKKVNERSFSRVMFVIG